MIKEFKITFGNGKKETRKIIKRIKWLNPSGDLQAVSHRAVGSAKSRRHEYVTLEHPRYSALEDKKFNGIVKNYGADPEDMKNHPKTYPDTKLDKIKNVNRPNTNPKKTVSVERVLNRAFRKFYSVVEQILI